MIQYKKYMVKEDEMETTNEKELLSEKQITSFVRAYLTDSRNGGIGTT